MCSLLIIIIPVLILLSNIQYKRNDTVQSPDTIPVLIITLDIQYNINSKARNGKKRRK